jgi:hypothetical protein
LEVLESLRTTREKGISADEETNSLQAFRAVEKSLENDAELDEKKELVSSLLTDTFKEMSKNGIKVNLLNPDHQVKLNFKNT